MADGRENCGLQLQKLISSRAMTKARTLRWFRRPRSSAIVPLLMMISFIVAGTLVFVTAEGNPLQNWFQMIKKKTRTASTSQTERPQKQGYQGVDQPARSNSGGTDGISSNLQDQLTLLKQQLAQANQQLERTNHELSELRDNQNKSRQIEQEKAALQAEYAQATKKLAALENKQHALLADQKRELEKGEAKRIKEATREAEQTAAKKFKQKIIDANDKARDVEREMLTLKGQMAEVQHNFAALQVQHQALVRDQEKFIEQEVSQRVKESSVKAASDTGALSDQQLQDELSNATSRIKALEKENETMQRANKLARKLYSTMEDKYDNLVEKKNHLIEEEVSKRVKKAKEELETKWMRQVSKAMDQIKSLENDKEALEREKERSKAQYEALEEQNREELLQRDLATEKMLKEKVKEVENRWKTDMDAQNDRMAVLHRVISELRSDLSYEKNKYAKLEKERDLALGQKNAEVAQSVAEEAKSMKQKIDDEWKQKLAELKDKMAKELKEKVRSMMDAAEQAKKASEQAMADLKASHRKDVETLMSKHQAMITEMQASIDSHNDEIQKMQRQKSDLAQSVKNLERKVKDKLRVSLSRYFQF